MKIRIDYQLHALAGSAIASFSLHYVEWYWALCLVVLIGAAKEIVYDKWMDKGTPERMDFLCTLAAGFGTIGLIKLLNIIL